MTVKELIDVLSDLPGEVEIVVNGPVFDHLPLVFYDRESKRCYIEEGDVMIYES